MKKRLLLITNGFPFGQSERSFLGEEVKQIQEAFDLYILAPENQEKLLYPVDGIRRIERYTFTAGKKLRAMLQLLDIASIKEVLRLARRHHFLNLRRDCKTVLRYRYYGWQLQQQISKLVQEEKIDIVYTYWCTECTLAALYVKRRFPELKVITRFHGYDLYEERTALGWQPFRTEIAARCDGLCFPSKMGRAYFLKHWKTCPEEKAHICYIGSVRPAPGEKKRYDTLRLVSCSNIIPLKRIERIIEGLALLPKSVNVVWTHFGEGSERERLEALAKEKLPDGVNVQWSFQGFVPNTELADRYRKFGADLFITTSSTEGMPVSLMEAFSLGIPVIATAVGGIPEMVIDDKTGYLLPEDVKAEDVAEAIMKFLGLTQVQRQEMSDSAWALWQDKFDAEKNACRFVSYLQELVTK